MKEKKTNKVKAWYDENKDIVKCVVCTAAGVAVGSFLTAYRNDRKNSKPFETWLQSCHTTDYKRIGFQEGRYGNSEPFATILFDTIEGAEEFANNILNNVKKARGN